MLVAVEQARHQITTAGVNFCSFITDVSCDITNGYHGILKNRDVSWIDLSRDHVDQLTITHNSRCWDLGPSSSDEGCDRWLSRHLQFNSENVSTWDIYVTRLSSVSQLPSKAFRTSWVISSLFKPTSSCTRSRFSFM